MNNAGRPIARCIALLVSVLLVLTANPMNNGVMATNVPLMFCANESADPEECQKELESARLVILPWFAQQQPRHRELLDCRRFCDHQEKHLTFQMPCQCTRNSRQRHRKQQGQRTDGRALQNSSPSPPESLLEGPIQVLHSFVEQMSDGRCKEKLGQMECFVTFVSSYEAKPSPIITDESLHILDENEAQPPPRAYTGSNSPGSGTSGPGFTIIDEDDDDTEAENSTKVNDPALEVVEEPLVVKHPPTKSPTNISFDRDDDLLPKVPHAHHSSGGGGL